MRTLSTCSLLVLFGLLQVVLIGIVLYQKSSYIALLYGYQDLERQHAALHQELLVLTQQQAALQRHDHVVSYVRDALGMVVMPLSSVHALDDVLCE